MAFAAETPPPPLGTFARLWRLSAIVVGLCILGYGQLADTNDIFPLGSLSQYGKARDPNGTVTTFYLEADTTAGTRVRVPLDPRGVGVGRSEIESQVGRIRADHSLLQAIADAQAGLHPDRPQYRTVYLMISTRQLKDGKAVGEPKITQNVEWQVR